MDVTDEEDDWNSESADDDGHAEGRDDEVVILETSTSGDSAEFIFLLTERNEDNTDWLCPEGMMPSSDFNKLRSEDIGKARQQKELFA